MLDQLVQQIAICNSMWTSPLTLEHVALQSCTLLSTIYTENFDLSDGDFTVTKTANYATPTWAWGQPASGPGQAHSPTSLWATKLDGDYSSNGDSYLVSPVIDLSAYTGQAIILNWWQWLQTEYAYDVAMVQASTDGGSRWRTAHEGMSGDFDLAWTRRGVVLDSSVNSFFSLPLQTAQ